MDACPERQMATGIFPGNVKFTRLFKHRWIVISRHGRKKNPLSDFHLLAMPFKWLLDDTNRDFRMGLPAHDFLHHIGDKRRIGFKFRPRIGVEYQCPKTIADHAHRRPVAPKKNENTRSDGLFTG